MHFKRADLIMGLIGLILVVASSYQLINTQRKNSEEGIAWLEMIQQTVKTRQGTDLFWSTPSKGSAIQDNQMIFTAPGSAARINFDDGNEIEVGENSLVKISASNLNLLKGEVTTNLTGNDLEIQIGTETLKLKSDDAQVAIQKSGDKTLIGVVSGVVDVIGEDKKVINASVSNIVEVGKGKLTVKKRMELNPLPKVSQRFYTSGSKYAVRFGDYPGEILISPSKDFKKARTYRSGEVFGPGIYYWRVISETHESLIFQFEIVKDNPPKIFRPTQEYVLKTGLPAKLNFQWELTGGETEIEIVNPQGELNRTVVLNSSWGANLELAGIYRWRVRKLYHDFRDASWTQWQELRVVDLSKDVPSDLRPLDFEVQTYDLDSEVITFSWNYSGEAQVAIRHESGKVETLKAQHQLNWKVSGEGNFFIKVKAFDNPLDIWSSESHIRVKDLSKEKNLEVYTVELSRPDQDVNFSWKESSLKNADYLFELSRTQDFKDIILKRRVKGAEIKVSVPEVGSYFWRSRVYSNGKWKASVPKRIVIKPTPAPTRPESLPKLRVPLKLKKTTSLFRFLSTAYASENTFISIELPPNENAKYYRLEIFRDEKLEKRIFRKVSKRNVITWPGAMSGTFYYRYSIIDHWERESEFSEASLLEVTAEHLRPASPKELKLSVKDKKVHFFWEKDRLASFYQVEVADNKDFRQAKVITTPLNYYQFDVKTGHYFLRVKALNDFGESNFKQRHFKITFKDNVLKEEDKNIIFAVYRPSLDEMTFTDGKSGKVKGEVLAATELRYERKDRFQSILKADFSLGKVFKKESYQQLSLEGSVGYLFFDSEWRFSLGPTLKWWSLPHFSIREKVTSESKGHHTLGGHLRFGRSLLENEFIFDQYFYISGVKGFLSELSYRRSLERFHLFTGLGFENIEFSEQKKSALILKMGLGLSF